MRNTDRRPPIPREHGVDRIRQFRTARLVDTARVDPDVCEPEGGGYATALNEFGKPGFFASERRDSVADIRV